MARGVRRKSTGLAFCGDNLDGLQSIFISLVCTHTHDFSDGHFGFGNLAKSMGRPKETLDLAYARSHLGYVV